MGRNCEPQERLWWQNIFRTYDLTTDPTREVPERRLSRIWLNLTPAQILFTLSTFHYKATTKVRWKRQKISLHNCGYARKCNQF